MPTWTELQEFARSKYTLANDEESWFSVVFREENDRTQKIVVTRFTAFNKEWVEFRTAVCKEDEMAPVVALRKNAEMSIGFLALAKGMYWLLHNAALDTLDIVEFELPLEYLSTFADKLEQQYSAGNDDF